ncbi:hypothetical protein SVIOM342S_00120 [Streptomyces violaceorubidus]
MDRAQHGGEHVTVGLGLLEPVVGQGVRCRPVALVQTGVELVGGVDTPPVGVEGQARYGREDQGAGGAHPGGGTGVHGAAEEDGARGVGGEQRVRTVRQVDGLDAVVGEAAGRRDDPVELGEALDLPVVGGVVGLELWQ